MKNFNKNQRGQRKPARSLNVAILGRSDGSFLPFQPHRLISLWDMIEFYMHHFRQNWEAIQVFAINAEIAARGENSGALLTKKRLEEIQIKSIPLFFAFICYHLDLPETRRQADILEAAIENDRCSYQTINAMLKAIIATASDEINETSFALIPKEKAEYFESDILFGKDFHKKASSEINAEIKDAGNCLAADLKTAAAFHLMRVAEFGLRQLAQHRPAINQPDLAHLLTEKRAVEEATWKMVYQAIDTEIRSRKNAGTISTTEAEFYSHLMIQIRSFQFAWRDPVMHARFERPHEVDDMFDAVKKFMRELMAGGIPLK